MVDFDLRTFYLRDLTFTGSTVIDPPHGEAGLSCQLGVISL